MMSARVTRTRHWLRLAAALAAAQFTLGLAIGTWLALTGRADAFTAKLGGLL